jgi:Uma2 family endonuclease
MAQPDFELKRWTRVEYEQLVERGIFTRADRMELIDGLLIVSEPQSAYHYTTIRVVARALARAFGSGWDVRTEAPVALDETSEPEPDVAVVRGELLDYLTEHPRDPVLVVEVALSSVALDRRYKSSLYARAQRPEYWVVNLMNRTLEVRREPGPSPSAPYGWDYRVMQVFQAPETVTPLAMPAARIPIADLLPQRSESPPTFR